jgi:MFS family permease
MFGLFQGGIVPSYAIIVREHFPAANVGASTGTIIMASLVGMALGGWLSGKITECFGTQDFINFLFTVLCCLVSVIKRIFHYLQKYKSIPNGAQFYFCISNKNAFIVSK